VTVSVSTGNFKCPTISKLLAVPPLASSSSDCRLLLSPSYSFSLVSTRKTRYKTYCSTIYVLINLKKFITCISSGSTSVSSSACFRFFFLVFRLVAVFLDFLRADSGTSSSSSDSIFLFTLGNTLDLENCINIFN